MATKKKILVFCILISLMLNLGVNGYNSTDSAETKKQEPTGVIKVVTSLSLLADWATEIGGDLFSPISIVTGNEDPHTFDLLADDINTIAEADLFIYLGLEGIEPWVETAINAAEPASSIAIATDNMIIFDPLTGKTNPHIWMSPFIVKDLVKNMTKGIITADPTNQAQYELNRDTYLSKLDDLIVELQTTYYNIFNGLKVIIHHPAFIYLFNIIGVIRAGVIEEVEGSEPSAQHIQEITEIMKVENISIIVTQPQIDEKQIIQLARDTNSKLAKLTPLLGIEGAETYIDMIYYDLNALQNPEAVPPSNLTTIIIIVGASVLGVVIIGLVYIRFFRK